MAKRLGEIANEPLRMGVVLLGEKADVVAEAQEVHELTFEQQSAARLTRRPGQSAYFAPRGLSQMFRKRTLLPWSCSRIGPGSPIF